MKYAVVRLETTIHIFFWLRWKFSSNVNSLSQNSLAISRRSNFAALRNFSSTQSSVLRNTEMQIKST